MHIQYYLANGEEINFQTVSDIPTFEEVSQLALLVAQKKPKVLPKYVFINVRIYHMWVASLNIYGPPQVVPGTNILQIWTAVGPLGIQIMPWASDAKLFMIGDEEDFERYDVDKIFEEVVLKDCEKE
jgi:hypothetical protein